MLKLPSAFISQNESLGKCIAVALQSFIGFSIGKQSSELNPFKNASGVIRQRDKS